MKPIFPYVGSKTSECNTISKYLPVLYNEYYEPFCGSASLFFYLNNPIPSYLNDLNSDIISIYQLVKDNSVESILDRYMKDEKSKDKFMFYRDNYQGDQGYRMLYLLKNSYRNMLRYSNGRLISAPKQPMVKSLNLTQEHKDLLMNTKLTSINGLNLIFKITNSNAFVYIDPPYLSCSKGLYKDGVDIGYYEKMEKVLREVSYKWMVNISLSKEIEELFKNYQIDIYEKEYRVNGKKENHVVIRNYILPSD